MHFRPLSMSGLNNEWYLSSRAYKGDTYSVYVELEDWQLPPAPHVIHRFMSHVSPLPSRPGGDPPCHLWTGYIRPSGVPIFTYEGHYMSARRVSLAIHLGLYLFAFGDGRAIRFSSACKQDNCVNPAHTVPAHLATTARTRSATHRPPAPPSPLPSPYHEALATTADERISRSISPTHLRESGKEVENILALMNGIYKDEDSEDKEEP